MDQVTKKTPLQLPAPLLDDGFEATPPDWCYADGRSHYSGSTCTMELSSLLPGGTATWWRIHPQSLQAIGTLGRLAAVIEVDPWSEAQLIDMVEAFEAVVEELQVLIRIGRHRRDRAAGERA